MTLLTIFLKQFRLNGYMEIIIGASVLIAAYLFTRLRKSKAENQKLKAENQDLKREVADLKGIIVDLKQQLEDCGEPNNLCGNYSGNIETMEFGEVKPMIEFFKSSIVVGEESESVRFDLERIKQFIFHMENKVIRQYGVGEYKLGIRFYFATYPSTPNYSLEKRGKNTLLMVPTFDSGNGEHIDFDANLPVLNLDITTTYVNLLGENSVTGISGTSISQLNPSFSAMNHGMLFPPMN